jgi:uncharacterized protein (TIGR00375 family)
LKIFSDLQLHSKYALATSKDMDLEHLAQGAKVKGLNLLGTGDFTHPRWFSELQAKLEPISGTGLFSYQGMTWMLSGEVSTVYEQAGKKRKVHHLIYAPDFDTVEQIQESLSPYGNLSTDARPIIKNLTSPELVERVSGISNHAVVIPAHCLLPDQFLLCNPEVKRIAEVKPGDSIVTHRGSVRSVTRVFSRNYEGETLRITPWYFDQGVRVTPEHPFLATRTVKNCNWGGGICKPNAVHERNCVKRYFESYTREWVAAGELQAGDALPYPRPQEIRDLDRIATNGESAGFPREVPLNLEFCRLIGYYLAEGYTNSRDAIGFSFNRKGERGYVLDVKNLMWEIFRVKAKPGKTRGELVLYSQSLRKLFEASFYSGTSKRAASKSLPQWAMSLPKRKQAAIFRGWWRGDKGSTSSRVLANQMRLICLRLGIVPCVRVDSMAGHRKRGRHKLGGRDVMAKSDNFILEHLAFFEDEFGLLTEPEFRKFKAKTERRHGWIDERYVYLPIRRIDKEKYSGLVYNLEVEQDNSFLTESAAVHNCWTPWFGVFGSKSGFDSLEECYKDQAHKIFAIETGLSSDPPMNWRLSSLDRVALVSNSDAHSPNPWRLGREANLLELSRLTYKGVFDAIMTKDQKKFLFTIEVDPAYGKYHFSGHKKCGVSLAPREAARLGNRCPKCGKKLTVGVLQRVEELADRPVGYVPKNAIPYRHLLPLREVISIATGVKGLHAKSVSKQQDRLIKAFGSELAVLLDVPGEELLRFSTKRVASAIMAVREGRVTFSPGYDGVYGTPTLDLRK